MLLEGNFTAEFNKLRNETLSLLEEFKNHNPLIRFEFYDPLENAANQTETLATLEANGITAANLSVRENGAFKQQLVFPWAVAEYGSKNVKIGLLRNNLGNTQGERINNSVAQLEYALIAAVDQLISAKEKKIAILKGNGQIPDKYLSELLIDLGKKYRLAPFQLDSLVDMPQKVLDNLNRFDVLLVFKPTKAFSEREKYLLDQYIMNGGKTLWAIDTNNASLDSIQNLQTGTVVTARDLNLTDFFFKYGARFNYDLIKDPLNAPLTVIDPYGNEQARPWPWSPLVQTVSNHALTKGINVIKSEFAGSLDTLPNTIKKNILLQTSSKSALSGLPTQISAQFSDVPSKNNAKNRHVPVAILLEGQFTSVYKNRIKPVKLENDIDEGVSTDMILIADGDVVKYNLSNNRPLKNGLDPWLNQIFGNKEFLLNCINYLANDNELMHIRGKELQIALLDPEKVAQKKLKWQLIHSLTGIFLLFSLGWVYTRYRFKKYSQPF